MLDIFMSGFALTILVIVALVLTAVLSMAFRTVVPTDMVHIVQSKKKTISYGSGQPNGNVYFRWPSWVPKIGVTTKILPVSNFDLSLLGYTAYDKDRLPFDLDVTAFFRIKDTNKAAVSVKSVEKMMEQLKSIVQGAVRKILASHDINQIMVDRATFGQQFTTEVAGELDNWGVEPVKSMELMDIRDTKGSEVIHNIMAKKSSHIQMESRMEVAKNRQAAETAEIEAQRTIDISKQDAAQQVGERTATKEKIVGIAQQKSLQEVKVEEAETSRKQMDIVQVSAVRQAEIDKEAALVNADKQKQVAIVDAEGQLEATRRHAEGVKAQGEAKAAAEQAMQMAPVNAQIVLAKEIGTNEGYQKYLIAVESLKIYGVVGGEQAKALADADVKIIANSGDVSEGLKDAMGLFSSKGGTHIGAMLEGIKQVPEGQKALEAVQAFFNRPSSLNGATEPKAH